LPVPDNPLPHVNSRDETKQLLATLMAQSGDVPDEKAMAEVADRWFGDNPD